jgi:hypothetical protein
MDGLVEFLRARLDEDERIAREATGGLKDAHRWSVLNLANHPGAVGTEWGALVATDTALRPHADHIARHDPARVLAEVEAKRELIALHGPGEMEYTDGDVCMICDVREPEPFYPCKTLRLLALPYADHPDYREEWRP